MNAEKMQLVFATNNKYKLREIMDILGDSFKLLSLKDLNMDEDIPENEPSLEGNAMHKARYIYRILNINVFADDTGLETDVLNGLPGVHSARFAGENKNSDDNIDKLLGMMGHSKNRKAHLYEYSAHCYLSSPVSSYSRKRFMVGQRFYGLE